MIAEVIEKKIDDGVGIFTIMDREVELNEKLSSLRAGNWQTLKDMPRNELDGLADEIGRTPHIGEFSDGIAALRSEATQAIRTEQIKRDNELAAHSRKQQQRTAHIDMAANLISQAREQCGYAAQVDRDAPTIGKPFEAPDVEAMTDESLSAALDGYRAELDQIDKLPDVLYEQSSLVALLKGEDAKAISRELKADADAYAKRRESLVSAAQAVRAEIERREAKRRADEEAKSPQSLLARIEALEAQLREGENHE